MEKLKRMLQDAGGLELELEEHSLYTETRETYARAKRNNLLLNSLIAFNAESPIGQWQLFVKSSRGTISIIEAAHVGGGLATPVRWCFEIYCIEPKEKLFKECERYVTRAAVCRRVCLLLARTTMQIVDAWRDEHGR